MHKKIYDGTYIFDESIFDRVYESPEKGYDLKIRAPQRRWADVWIIPHIFITSQVCFLQCCCFSRYFRLHWLFTRLADNTTTHENINNSSQEKAKKDIRDDPQLMWRLWKLMDLDHLVIYPDEEEKAKKAAAAAASTSSTSSSAASADAASQKKPSQKKQSQPQVTEISSSSSAFVAPEPEIEIVDDAMVEMIVAQTGTFQREDEVVFFTFLIFQATACPQ